MKNLNSPRGLTLIEVILGLAISAVIFALVLGAVRLGLRSQEKGIERQDLSQRVRIISDRLGWLLRGAYPYIYTDPEDVENRELFFTGDNSSLRFVTTATDPYSESLQDLSGLKYIVISLDDSSLVIEEQVFFMGGDSIDSENRFILDTEISGLEFSYLDPVIDDEGDRGDPEWTGSWDGTEVMYLPLAVRVVVKLKGEETEIELPPVVATLRAGGALPTPATPGGTPQSAPVPQQRGP